MRRLRLNRIRRPDPFYYTIYGRGWRRRRSDDEREYNRKKSRIHWRKALEYAAGRKRPLVCDVCGKPPPGKSAMHFDHDHATMLFRGWLCHHCNVALANVHDDPELLEKLAAYLRNAPTTGRTLPPRVIERLTRKWKRIEADPAQLGLPF